MQKKVWLFLGVAAVLLAAIVFAKVSTPSAVSGGEVPKAAAKAVPAATSKPRPVKVPPSPVVETSEPQPLVPKVVAEVATEAVPTAQEPQPSDDGAPHVVAIFANTGDQFRALIGDALVSEGSTVRGYKVRKVQADSVVFEKDGQIWVQKLD